MPETGVAPLYIFASVGNLALAILIVTRARQARGSLPLTLLCLSLFLWALCEATVRLMQIREMYYLRLVGSTLAPAFLFHYVLHFVRREEKYRRHLWMLYGFTAIFVLMGASATLLGQQFREWSEVIRWVAAALIIVMGLNFLGVFRIGLLFRDEVRTEEERELYSNALREFTLLDAQINENDVAIIDMVALDEEGAPIPSEAEVLRNAAAQLVYTATGFPDVIAVRIRIDGERISLPTSEGDTEGVVDRNDYFQYDPSFEVPTTSTPPSTTAQSDEET